MYDADPNVHPGAPEICGDGSTTTATAPSTRDAPDADGLGSAAGSAQLPLVGFGAAGVAGAGVGAAAGFGAAAAGFGAAAAGFGAAAAGFGAAAAGGLPAPAARAALPSGEFIALRKA